MLNLALKIYARSGWPGCLSLLTLSSAGASTAAVPSGTLTLTDFLLRQKKYPIPTAIITAAATHIQLVLNQSNTDDEADLLTTTTGDARVFSIL